MALPGVCPSCGAKFPLQLALQDVHARKALLAALELSPSLATRLLAYLDLFSPGTERAIRMDRLARLLEEFAGAVRAGFVTANRRDWPAPLPYWERALDATLSRHQEGKLRTPLKDHRYLFAVIAGLGDQAEARRERERERDPRGAHEQEQRERAADAEAQEQGEAARRQVREYLERAGRRPREGTSDA